MDTKGRVWSWGNNDKLQLGRESTDESHYDVPGHVDNVANAVQIYTGDYMNFVVEKDGCIKAWGLNKNNCLLTN